jgi:hypothetical protein
MSRAFVKEVEPETIELPDRAVSSHPNLVTAQGLAAIERTVSRFEEAARAAIAKNDRAAIAATQRELRYWNRDDRPQRSLSRQPIKAKYISGRR